MTALNEDSRLAADALHWQSNSIQHSRDYPREKEHGTGLRMNALWVALESGEAVVVPTRLLREAYDWLYGYGVSTIDFLAELKAAIGGKA